MANDRQAKDRRDVSLPRSAADHAKGAGNHQPVACCRDLLVRRTGRSYRAAVYLAQEWL